MRPASSSTPERKRASAGALFQPPSAYSGSDYYQAIPKDNSTDKPPRSMRPVSGYSVKSTATTNNRGRVMSAASYRSATSRADKAVPGMSAETALDPKRRVHVQAIASRRDPEGLAEEIFELKEKLKQANAEKKLLAVDKRRYENELTRLRSGLMRAEELLQMREITLSPNQGSTRLFCSPERASLTGRLKEQCAEMAAERDEMLSELERLKRSTRATRVAQLEAHLTAARDENKVLRQHLDAAETAARVASDQAMQAIKTVDTYIRRPGSARNGEASAAGGSGGGGGGSALIGGVGKDLSNEQVLKSIRAMQQAHRVMLSQVRLLRMSFPNSMTTEQFTSSALANPATAGAPMMLNFLEDHVTLLDNEMRSLLSDTQQPARAARARPDLATYKPDPIPPYRPPSGARTSSSPPPPRPDSPPLYNPPEPTAMQSSFNQPPPYTPPPQSPSSQRSPSALPQQSSAHSDIEDWMIAESLMMDGNDSFKGQRPPVDPTPPAPRSPSPAQSSSGGAPTTTYARAPSPTQSLSGFTSQELSHQQSMGGATANQKAATEAGPPVAAPVLQQGGGGSGSARRPASVVDADIELRSSGKSVASAASLAAGHGTTPHPRQWLRWMVLAHLAPALSSTLSSTAVSGTATYLKTRRR